MAVTSVTRAQSPKYSMQDNEWHPQAVLLSKQRGSTSTGQYTGRAGGPLKPGFGLSGEVLGRKLGRVHWSEAIWSSRMGSLGKTCVASLSAACLPP
jgi:hypothetical protein